MIIVGLGNPGDEYCHTKHNFGFWVLDFLVKKSSLKWKSGYGDYVYTKISNHIYAKPTTYMNNSGLAVRDLCKHYNQSKVLIVYDDIDLPLGSIRYKSNGGSGGHRGIQSIIYQLKSDQFDRLRIGIGVDKINMRPSERYVLSPFPKELNEEIELVVQTAVDSIDFYINSTIDKTMNKYNKIIKGET